MQALFLETTPSPLDLNACVVGVDLLVCVDLSQSSNLSGHIVLMELVSWFNWDVCATFVAHLCIIMIRFYKVET
jgi:hypothetical protein